MSLLEWLTLTNLLITLFIFPLVAFVLAWYDPKPKKRMINIVEVLDYNGLFSTFISGR